MELKNEMNEINEIKQVRKHKPYKKKYTEEEMKERIKESNRRTYKQRMEKIAERGEQLPYSKNIKCNCGVELTISHYYRHLKSNKHKKLMEEQKPKYEVHLICGNAEDLENMGYVVN